MGEAPLRVLLTFGEAVLMCSPSMHTGPCGIRSALFKEPQCGFVHGFGGDVASVWEAAVGGAVCQEKAVAAPACSAEALCWVGGAGEPPDLPGRARCSS